MDPPRCSTTGSSLAVTALAAPDGGLVVDTIINTKLGTPRAHDLPQLGPTTEETTTGVHKLKEMAMKGESFLPAINVND